MTPQHPQPEYIISDILLGNLEEIIRNRSGLPRNHYIFERINDVRSRLHTQACNDSENIRPVEFTFRDHDQKIRESVLDEFEQILAYEDRERYSRLVIYRIITMLRQQQAGAA